MTMMSNRVHHVERSTPLRLEERLHSPWPLGTSRLVGGIARGDVSNRSAVSLLLMELLQPVVGFSIEQSLVFVLMRATMGNEFATTTLHGNRRGSRMISRDKTVLLS